MTEKYRVQANYKIRPFTRDRIRLLGGLLKVPGGNVIDKAIDMYMKSSEVRNLLRSRSESSRRMSENR